MSVRIRVTIEYDWDQVGDEISQTDLDFECQDWIAGRITADDLFSDKTRPNFKAERIAS